MIERMTGHVPLWLFALVIVAALAGPGLVQVVEDAGRPPAVVQAPVVLLPAVAPNTLWWVARSPSPAPLPFISCTASNWQQQIACAAGQAYGPSRPLVPQVYTPWDKFLVSGSFAP